MDIQADISKLLHQCWGYPSFRPMQKQIIGSLLAGRDTCVVMPTGGGKSLCYQLPAAMHEGKTAVVISPLIALMQDQVAQLTQLGIPAQVLNSTIGASRQMEAMQEAVEGKFRLLYLSPERLAKEDTVAWLQRVPVSFFVVDEAHCISEWGHEFRPDYRQLNRLRRQFPRCPIAAFTASATSRVRHDILEQLHLHEPAKFIASFHRPNLRYSARECDLEMQGRLLEKALRGPLEGSAIVYAPTINRVEETVDFLQDKGIDAIAYHGRMDSATRRRNQERWMSDEVRVLVGTIAFGLGINKAAVRMVIHLALPKSLEQYYQESGRAGRDGKPAECVLLWRKADAGVLTYFIRQIGDETERDRAWQRYRDIRTYAESTKCRHLQICRHFGENPKWRKCGACDVCEAAPAWLSVPAETKPSKQRRPKAGKSAALREGQTADVIHGSAGAAPSQAKDDALREYLRQWRREEAEKRAVPAFVVLHDTSLDELCRCLPRSREDLLSIPGIGERKFELYGDGILEALRRFEGGARAAEKMAKKPKPVEETMAMLAEGRTFEEIAMLRERQPGTVIALVAELIEEGLVEFRSEWVSEGKRARIEAACVKHGLGRLKPIKNALPPEFTYDEIRLVVAHIRQSEANKRHR